MVYYYSLSISKSAGDNRTFVNKRDFVSFLTSDFVRKDIGYFQPEPKGITDGSLCITHFSFYLFDGWYHQQFKKLSRKKKKMSFGSFQIFRTAHDLLWDHDALLRIVCARYCTSAALPCVWITKRKRTSKSKDNNFNSGLLLFWWRVIARTRK